MLFNTVWQPTAAEPSFGIAYIVLTSIIGTAFGTLGLPVYFGYRRYRKQEEREMEMTIIKAIKDLRELGFIKPDDSIESQRNKAVDWLSKPTNNL